MQLQQNGIFYVTDSATVTISNSRSDVYHEYRYIINGSGGNWIVENSTSFSLDLGDGNDSKNLRLELRVKMQGTSFSNTTYSNLMSVDLLGPSVSLVSNPVVSNGSLIDLSSTYSGVEISHYIWSWNNGSTIQLQLKSGLCIFLNSFSKVALFLSTTSVFTKSLP